MLIQIVLFELKYRFQRPATYVYFAILFLVGFAFMASPDASVSDAGEQLNANAPYIVSQLISVLLLFSTVIIAGIMGVPIYRDFDSNFNEIIFSLPIKNWQYLGGRFLGSYFISILIHLGIVLGILTGTFMPWIEDADLGPFVIQTYLNPVLYMLLPNLFILGMLFFSIGSLFRTQIAIYTQGIMLLVLFFAISMTNTDLDTNPLRSVLDPFGMEAVSYHTKYWTTFEKNTLQLPLSGYLLLNRILWIALAAAVGFITLRIFKPTPFAFLQSKQKASFANPETTGRGALALPTIEITRTWKDKVYQWWYYSRFHALRIMKAIPFSILMLCSAGMVILSLASMGIMGTPQLPVTYMLLDFLSSISVVFLVIIISIYSGELIWKDIDSKFAPLIDSLPLSNRWLLVSKFTSMVLVELVMLAFLMLTGIILQTIDGFYNYQVTVYLKVLLLNTFPYLVIITFLIFFIHTLVNNKFVGHSVVVGFYLLVAFSGKLGLNHVLFRYGSTISQSYSDMNGFTHFVYPSLVVRSYWFMLGLVFLSLSILLIKRGNERGLRMRIQHMKNDWKGSTERIVIPVALSLFILLGAYIYYNTNVLNTYRTKKEERAYKAEYENTYSQYENYPAPHITDVDLKVDLYPNKIRFDINGQFQLINKNSVPLDTLHLRTISWMRLNDVNFSVPVELIDSAQQFGYYMYKMLEPIMPGDSFSMNIDYVLADKGFHHWGHSTAIVGNGSFINMSYMPYFGYAKNEELRDKKERKKAGLPEKSYESPEISDTSYYHETYISGNADRVSYQAVISTEPDQIAISCGTLVADWKENGRRYFKYQMKEPIWNFYPFLSADYEIYEEEYEGITISVYYHKGHDYNLETMVRGIKRTVDYCARSFSPFQHDQIRIVEFPRYAQFAQSYAGTIPFSEGLGFILDVDSKRDIDVPFFVTSHEVAHQWWGHQICSAPVKGYTLMVESMAEYTSLMVLLEEYGHNQAQKFLKYELDKYMMMRGLERKKEPPLYLVDDQQYLSYQKGCLAMYNLHDFIGEDSINSALSRFIETYGHREAPYPTSLDFLEIIGQSVPDSLNYLIHDWFKTITLHGNRTDSATYKQLDNGQYLVSVHTTSKKFQADSLGKQKKIELNDWLEIGVYTHTAAKKDSLIYLEKVLVQETNNTFEVLVDYEPSKAGIDPINKQIDRNLFDNVKKVVPM